MSWTEIEDIVRSSLGNSIPDDLDWFPEIKDGLTYFCSDICDRVSDRLKIAPAALAYNIKSALASSCYNIEFNNRGYLFRPTNSDIGQSDKGILQPPNSQASPSSAVVYIQPPTSSHPDLNYLKLFSQAAMQISALQNDQAKFTVIIPGIGKTDLFSMKSEGVSQPEQFRRLLDQLIMVAKLPSSCQLDIISDFVDSEWVENRATICLWLTNEFLGLGGVSVLLNNLRVRYLAKANLYIRSTNIDGLSKPSDVESFQNTIQHGAALFSYIGLLEHAQDLDWEVPTLTNWLSLKNTLINLKQRLLLEKNGHLIEKKWSIGSKAEFDFLSENLQFLYNRLKYTGAVAEGLKYLKRYCSLAHFALNQGLAPNNLTSLGGNFSSIIQ